MSPSNAAGPDPSVMRLAGHPILWNTLIFGVLSGAALSAIAYYRIVAGDDAAAVLFGALALFLWATAGFMASRRAASTRAGALTGLFSGALGAALGFAAHQVILQQYTNDWYLRLAQQCAQPSSLTPCVDKPTLLSNEMSLAIVTLIVWPLAGLILGLVAGFVGSTSAPHDTVGDEYDGGRVTLRPPLVPSHRTSRGQGQDIPQSERPSF